MPIKFKKLSLPQASDVFIVSGLAALAVGIGFEWGWPLAAVVDGILILGLGFLMASKG